MSLKQITLEAVGWIQLAQNKKSWQTVLNTVMNSRFPLNADNFGLAENYSSLKEETAPWCQLQELISEEWIVCALKELSSLYFYLFIYLQFN